MCQLVASFLLVFPLINLSVGRPTMMQASRRVVVTAGGQLRAVVISRPGLRPVESFLGVQYATARRFRRPSPSTHGWQGVRVARDFGPVCPQRIPDMDQPSRTVSCMVVSSSREIFVGEFQTWINSGGPVPRNPTIPIVDQLSRKSSARKSSVSRRRIPPSRGTFQTWIV